MKILVTGCAGFIGTNFLHFEFEHHPDYKIVGVDCLSYAANLKALDASKENPHFKFYKNDICDRESIYKIFDKERPDIVVNFAAESHVDRSISDSEPFLRSNYLGVGVLLDASLKYGVKRFHQISTDEVYGDLPLDSRDSFNESSPLSPSSPYSASKAAADLLVLSYARTHGLPTSISRTSNNYGEYQHEEKLIPKVIKSALAGEPISVYGDGKNVRNWIHVRDNCRAIDAIIHNGREGEIYNVGGNTEISNLELIKLLLGKIGASEELICFTKDRPGHDRKYSLDSSKIKREFGFVTDIPFDSGIDETINFYK